MINFNGQGLQRKYRNKVDNEIHLSADTKSKDYEALRKHSQSKRAGREARLAERDEQNISPEKEMERLKKDPTKDIDVKKIVNNAKSKTNVLAREYGVKEPNNPEALAHDRLHCFTCDRRLDSPKHQQHNILTSSSSNKSFMSSSFLYSFGESNLLSHVKQ